MKRGRVAERARDLAAPPLAARQRRSRALRADARSYRSSSSASSRFCDRVGVEVLQLEDRAHVLRDGQLAEDRRFLRQVGQAAARAAVDRQARDRSSPSSSMRAAVGGDQADDHVEAGGLAGAVGPQQPDDFAARDLERDVVTTVRAL